MLSPILYEHTFTMDFKQKAEIFNFFFANQFTPIDNNSKPLVELVIKTQDALSTVVLTENCIVEKIIRNLDTNRVYGQDKISICMLKIYGNPVSKPLDHCVKSVQIRSFFWSVFSHIRTKYGP